MAPQKANAIDAVVHLTTVDVKTEMETPQIKQTSEQTRRNGIVHDATKSGRILLSCDDLPSVRQPYVQVSV